MDWRLIYLNRFISLEALKWGDIYIYVYSGTRNPNKILLRVGRVGCRVFCSKPRYLFMYQQYWDDGHLMGPRIYLDRDTVVTFLAVTYQFDCRVVTLHNKTQIVTLLPTILNHSTSITFSFKTWTWNITPLQLFQH